MKMQTFVSFKGHPSLEKLGARLTLLIPRRTTYPCILYHIGDARGSVILNVADENAPTATPCLSKHIDNEWRLRANCKVC